MPWRVVQQQRQWPPSRLRGHTLLGRSARTSDPYEWHCSDVDQG